MKIPRRKFLLQAVEAGGLVLSSQIPRAAVAASRAVPGRKPTPPDDLGPFYRRLAPHQAMLRRPGDPGMPLRLTGAVFSAKGRAIPDASLEIWQANGGGIYDTGGYRYRTSLTANAKGGYAVDTVIPGHYPGRVCQHVHYLVRAEGHKPLVTELYFATDPVFEGDPDKNYARDPVCTSRELVRPVVITGEPKAIVANVTFDLVLEH